MQKHGVLRQAFVCAYRRHTLGGNTRAVVLRQAAGPAGLLAEFTGSLLDFAHGEGRFSEKQAVRG